MALAPLAPRHVRQLVQLELSIDDYILLQSPELSGGRHISAVTGQAQGELALRMMPEQFDVNYRILMRELEDLPCVLAADAHDPEPQLEGTKVVAKDALYPMLRHHLGRFSILFEANLETS